MKKALCLLLCLLMLFCIGCQKEEVPEPQLNQGTFYTSVGITYNTHIRTVLTTQELVAPVTSLTVEIQNDTDYIVQILDDPAKFKWEKWEDDEWVAVTHYADDEIVIDIERGFLYIPINPREKLVETSDFSKRPLEPGTYRLQVNVSITNKNEELPLFDFPLIKGTRCITDVYFTILPAPEA